MAAIMSAMLKSSRQNFNSATKIKMSDEEVEICTQDENKCLEELVKAILMLDYTKKPFKQSDISKFLSKKPSRKKWNVIFDKAKVNLQKMGYSLLEVKNSGSKTYILTSCLFPLPSFYKLAEEEELADRTLLILVLSYIFIKEGVVDSVDLFKHLEDLKIYREEKSDHEYFGDVKKKILNDFVSQLYLEKVIDKEAGKFFFKWGERAHAEVSKRQILNFVCDVGCEGTIKPENLVSHYQTVLEDEKTSGDMREGGNDDDEEELMLVDD